MTTASSGLKVAKKKSPNDLHSRIITDMMRSIHGGNCASKWETAERNHAENLTSWLRPAPVSLGSWWEPSRSLFAASDPQTRWRLFLPAPCCIRQGMKRWTRAHWPAWLLPWPESEQLFVSILQAASLFCKQEVGADITGSQCQRKLQQERKSLNFWARRTMLQKTFYLLVCCFGSAISDVFHDTSREQHGFLVDESNGSAAQPGWTQFPHIPTVYANTPSVHIVKSLQ